MNSALCQNKISANTVNPGSPRGCESLVVKKSPEQCRREGISPLSDECAQPICGTTRAAHGLGRRGTYEWCWGPTQDKDVDNCGMYFDPFTMEYCDGGTTGYDFQPNPAVVAGMSRDEATQSAQSMLDRLNNGLLPGVCYESNAWGQQCEVPSQLSNDPLIRQPVDRALAVDTLRNKWKLNCGERLPGTCEDMKSRELCEKTFSKDNYPPTGYEHCKWDSNRCIPFSGTGQPRPPINPEDVVDDVETDMHTCMAVGDGVTVADFHSSFASAPLISQRSYYSSDDGINPGDPAYGDPTCNWAHAQSSFDGCPFSHVLGIMIWNVHENMPIYGECTEECSRKFINWYDTCFSDDAKKEALAQEMRLGLRKHAERWGRLSVDEVENTIKARFDLIQSIHERSTCVTNRGQPAGERDTCERNDPCGDHGNCRDSGDDQTIPRGELRCDCGWDWSGEHCEVDPECTLSQIQCGDHGTCQNGSCVCMDGWGGNNCERDLLCDGVECGANGACSGGRCVCVDGWSGEHCEVDPACTRSRIQCVNGTCQNGSCVCQRGYQGEHCEIKAVPDTSGYINYNAPEGQQTFCNTNHMAQYFAQHCLSFVEDDADVAREHPIKQPPRQRSDCGDDCHRFNEEWLSVCGDPTTMQGVLREATNSSTPNPIEAIHRMQSIGRVCA